MKWVCCELPSSPGGLAEAIVQDHIWKCLGNIRHRTKITIWNWAVTDFRISYLPVLAWWSHGSPLCCPGKERELVGEALFLPLPHSPRTISWTHCCPCSVMAYFPSALRHEAQSGDGERHCPCTHEAYREAEYLWTRNEATSKQGDKCGDVVSPGCHELCWGHHQGSDGPRMARVFLFSFVMFLITLANVLV